MRPAAEPEVPRQARIVVLSDEACPFVLESGRKLGRLDVAYESWGRLDQDGTNVVLVCHALTANSHAGSASGEPEGWWNALIGPGRVLDTDRYFVVCPNLLGSCYGTTGPTSIDPASGRRYGRDFPEISIRDIVRVQKMLMDRCGVRHLRCAVGSSLGGMQVLEWGLLYPEFCGSLIPISVAASQTAWCLALNAIARTAITSDPVWAQGRYTRQPKRGLSLARMVGMASYRSPQEFEQRFGRARSGPNEFDPATTFEVERYLRHQGLKLAARFDANSYLTLSRAMDRHDVGHARGGVRASLGMIRIPALCIGVTTDFRYPLADQQAIADAIPGAELAVIDSIHGHDAFLLECDKLSAVMGPFLAATGRAQEVAA